MADTTLARIFWDRVEKSAARPARSHKRGAVGEPLPGREGGEAVREIAAGLVALGRRPGEAVGILSASRAEWVQADFAIFSAGCVTIPVYPTYPPDLIQYIVNDAGVKTLIVEDPAQLAKVLEADTNMPGLDQIIVIQGYEGKEPSPRIFTWEALRRLGRERAEALKTELAGRVAGTKLDDVATIVYTSGTTGPPKGVVQTHGNHVAAVSASGQATPAEEGWVHLLFLPLAHSFARLESFLGPYKGLTTAFAENLDKVGDNLKEVHPHFICSVPRVFEKVYGKILSGVEAGSPLKKRIFNWAMDVGREISRRQRAGQPVTGALALKRNLADRLVFEKLHAAFGGRLRWAVSGGAPLSPEIAEFFHAAGILLLEGYGLTETCPALTFNGPARFKFGSVGQALPGVELKFAAD